MNKLDYTIHNYRGIKGSNYRFTEKDTKEDFVKCRELERIIKDISGLPLKVGHNEILNITIHNFYREEQ